MNIYLSCLLGLLIGGLMGGLGMAFLQQIRMGKVPPLIGLGPIKIDLSSLAPKGQAGAVEAEWGDMETLVEGTGTISSGCLALIGAGMVLVGFVLPWVSCNIPFLLSGSISGFSLIIQLATGIILSFFGVGVSGDAGAVALGGAVIIFLILLALVLLLIPINGYRIGRAGLSLIQSPKSSNFWRREISKVLTRSAIIGLIPLVFFITGANIQFSGLLNLIGFSVNSTDYGIWVTIGGFAVAIIAGIAISTTAAYSEQLASRPKTQPTTPPILEPKTAQRLDLTEDEQKVLKLISDGSDNIEIANKLDVSPARANVITTDLMEKFGVQNNTELLEQAKMKGYL